MDVAPRLRVLLRQADLKWTVGGLLLDGRWRAGYSVGYAVYWRTGAGAFGAWVGSGRTGHCRFFTFCGSAPKRFEKFEQHLPEALDSSSALCGRGIA